MFRFFWWPEGSFHRLIEVVHINILFDRREGMGCSACIGPPGSARSMREGEDVYSKGLTDWKREMLC